MSGVCSCRCGSWTILEGSPCPIVDCKGGLSLESSKGDWVLNDFVRVDIDLGEEISIESILDSSLDLLEVSGKAWWVIRRGIKSGADNVEDTWDSL